MVDKRQFKFNILKHTFLIIGIVVFFTGSVHLILDLVFRIDVGMERFVAISFTLIGLALFCRALHLRIVTLCLSTLCFCYVLFEWIVSYGRFYDFLLHFQRLDSHLGLMAISLALILFCAGKSNELILWISGLITAWVAGVSLLIIFGNLIEITYNFWPYGISLSLLDAVMFLLIDATILLRLALGFRHRFPKHFPIWSGLLVGVLVFSAVLFSWMIFQAQDKEKIKRETQEKMSFINEGILNQTATVFVSLDEQELSPWIVGTALLNKDGELIKSSGKLHPLPENDSNNQLRDVSFKDGKIMIVISPEEDGNYHVAFIETEAFFAQAISDVIENQYTIKVMVNGVLYFGSGELQNHPFTLQENLPLYGSLLTIVISPNSEYLLTLERPLPLFNLLLGITLALALSFMIYFAQQATQRRKEAEQASSEKTFFLKNVSHELRSPLHGILGSYSLLEQTDLTESQQKWLNAIGESGHNLLELVNQLLNISMAEVGDVVITKKPVDLHKLLESLLAEYNDVAQQKKLKLQLVYNSSLPAVFMVDDTRLKELIAHLVENALKFTTFGSVRVVVEGVNIKSGDYLLTICVEDSGDGISEGQLSTIFSTYHSLDVRGQKASSGMGLAYTKRLAEFMGGNLTVTSKIKEGSTFKLEIPVEAVL